MTASCNANPHTWTCCTRLKDRFFTTRDIASSCLDDIIDTGTVHLLNRYSESMQTKYAHKPAHALYMVRVSEFVVTIPNIASWLQRYTQRISRHADGRMKRRDTNDIVTVIVTADFFAKFCYTALDEIARGVRERGRPFADGALVYVRAQSHDDPDSPPDPTAFIVKISRPGKAALPGQGWRCMGPPLHVLSAAGGSTYKECTRAWNWCTAADCNPGYVANTVL